MGQGTQFHSQGPSCLRIAQSTDINLLLRSLTPDRKRCRPRSGGLGRRRRCGCRRLLLKCRIRGVWDGHRLAPENRGAASQTRGRWGFLSRDAKYAPDDLGPGNGCRRPRYRRISGLSASMWESFRRLSYSGSVSCLKLPPRVNR